MYGAIILQTFCGIGLNTLRSIRTQILIMTTPAEIVKTNFNYKNIVQKLFMNVGISFHFLTIFRLWFRQKKTSFFEKETSVGFELE